MMQLGFLAFEVRDPAAWRTFMTGVLGLVEVEQSGRYRMDGHEWRFSIEAGAHEDLAAVGWELDEEGLTATIGRLQAAGVELVEGDPGVRGAKRRVLCTDPAGVPVELVTGLARASTPFRSPLVPGGFVADGLGLGHLVLTAPDPAASDKFYRDLLGFRLSDRIVTNVHGHPVDLSFFHNNARHHSLAFGGPQRKRLHHFLVEAREMDEVGRAMDRAVKAGIRIMQTLGRHPNDRMFSFYAQTPGRFQFEFGWGAREVDDATWQTTTYDHISEWGHHPPQFVPGSQG